MSCGRAPWNGFLSGGSIPLPEALVVAEEECFVLQNRPPQRPSKLAVESRRSQARRQRRIGRELIERVSCQLGPASPVIEYVPMEVVGSRFGLGAHHRGD